MYARDGHLEVVEALIAAGAEINQAENDGPLYVLLHKMVMLMWLRLF